LIKDLFSQELNAPLTLTPRQEDQIFDLLHAHDFVPLFLYHLPPGELESRFSEDFCLKIRNQAKQEAILDLESTVCIKYVLQEFEKQHIDSILLKGAALSHQIYPEAGLRPRSDADLLVPLNKFPDACTLLEQLGYSRTDPFAGDLVKVARVYSKMGRFNLPHVVDLHSEITSTHGPYREHMTYDRIKLTSISLPGLAPNAHCMSKCHALLHACFHSAQHYSHFGESLIWLYDIHLLLENLSEDELTEAFGLARLTKTSGLLAHGISRSHYWFLNEVPESIKSELINLEGDRSLEILEDNLELGIANRAISDIREISGVPNKIRYILQRLFPPINYMMETNNSKNLLRVPLLYVQRIINVAKLTWSKLKEITRKV